MKIIQRSDIIKIWEKISEKHYQNNTIIYNHHSIRSIYTLEDKNILIASGFDGTKFWNLNNFNMIFSINDANIYNYSETIKRIDCDRIILSNNNFKLADLDEIGFKLRSIFNIIEISYIKSSEMDADPLYSDRAGRCCNSYTALHDGISVSVLPEAWDFSFGQRVLQCRV